MTAKMVSSKTPPDAFPELNSRELEDMGCRGGELIIYGRLPMMVIYPVHEKDRILKVPELLFCGTGWAAVR